MALRRAKPETENQLELFAPTGKTHERTHTVRTDGRETLAPVLPQDGEGTRSQGTPGTDAPRSGGEDGRGPGLPDAGLDEAGAHGATSARPGLGDGPGAIHLPAARGSAVVANDPESVADRVNGHIFRRAPVESAPQPPRNQNNYRITDNDRLGEGSLKQKFRRNIAAVESLRRIEAENRPATAEEKAILVKYVGWGGLPQAFDSYAEDWRKEQTQLAEMLSEQEYEAARATTLNAHYTAPVVIRAMYQALARFGFEHGRVLEPACGIGHFIGLMPDSMHEHSLITGVEIDPLTSRIAKTLYPDTDIRAQPFEQARLADGFYDLAISNVPFGDYPVYDPRFHDHHFQIHDYFFAAALERVRPGGILMFITSKGTMDKLDSVLREYLSPRAELLGAVRLPNDAFKKNANTEVDRKSTRLNSSHG